MNFNIFFMNPLQRHFSISSLKRNIERHTFQLSLIWNRVPYRDSYCTDIDRFYTRPNLQKNKFIDSWRIEILFCIPPTTTRPSDLRYHLYLSNSRFKLRTRNYYVTSRHRSIDRNGNILFWTYCIFTPFRSTFRFRYFSRLESRFNRYLFFI